MVAVLGMARRSFDGASLTSSRHMQRLSTRLDGLVLLAPKVHGDERGFFVETFRADVAATHGVPTEFVQDNHSRSRRGTLRGIHFQTHPGQGKLVRVARGRVLDVVVDLRRGSSTFGEWEGVELDDVSGHALWIPVGFGHGFLVLSEVADFVYKCTNYYDPATEAGIRFDDPDVGIEWPSDVELLYSERDATAPRLSEVADSLPFTV
jgi:dTDP-4-dehydrorhamnose 3,5-epimerase